MKSVIFREYDIRGIVGTEITWENINNLTKAIVTYFIKTKPNINRISVGMDGRIHSPLIKEKIIETLLSYGIDVIDIGLCPTPLMYFSLFNHDIDAGLIVTASHNPKEYNGIKICLDKKSVWGIQIQEIRKIYENKEFNEPSLSKKGIIKNLDIIANYISWIKKEFNHLIGKDIKAIIDCGNGTAGSVLPILIKEMNWKNTMLLFPEIDGNFPNHEPDPTVEKNVKEIKKQLEEKKDYIGIGLDGDCDRMSALTEDGYLIPGDKLLSIFSKPILSKNPGASIVFDIKSSCGLIEKLNELGAKCCISPSGHSIIKEQMFLNKALLAGELSCHFFFNDKYFGYDDGIYAMLRLFEILHETNKSLKELLLDFPKKLSSPEYRIACNESDKEIIVSNVREFFKNKQPHELITIDGVRAHMKYGWGLARASNTQPVICLRFESETYDGLSQIKNDFLSALSKNFRKEDLENELNKF